MGTNRIKKLIVLNVLAFMIMIAFIYKVIITTIADDESKKTYIGCTVSLQGEELMIVDYSCCDDFELENGRKISKELIDEMGCDCSMKNEVYDC